MDECCASRTSNSRIRSPWARISAWAAHGVAAQISGGRGRAVSSIDRGIRRDRPGCNPLLPGGLNAYLLRADKPRVVSLQGDVDATEHFGYMPMSCGMTVGSIVRTKMTSVP